MHTFLKISEVLSTSAISITNNEKSISEAIALFISLSSRVKRYCSHPSPVTGLNKPVGLSEVSISRGFSSSLGSFTSVSGAGVSFWVSILSAIVSSALLSVFSSETGTSFSSWIFVSSITVSSVAAVELSASFISELSSSASVSSSFKSTELFTKSSDFDSFTFS